MDPIMEAIEAVTDRGVDCLQKLQRSNPHEDVYSSLETDLSVCGHFVSVSKVDFGRSFWHS